MTELILCQYEKYSSGVRDFDVLGSQTFPTKEWLHLGAFEATYAKREQLFVFPDPKYVRYIKVRFNTHHGDEASCTVSQLKVHGITVMEGMQDDLQRHQKELEEPGPFFLRKSFVCWIIISRFWVCPTPSKPRGSTHSVNRWLNKPPHWRAQRCSCKTMTFRPHWLT